MRYSLNPRAMNFLIRLMINDKDETAYQIYGIGPLQNGGKS